jgi:hypothetical protein
VYIYTHIYIYIDMKGHHERRISIYLPVKRCFFVLTGVQVSRSPGPFMQLITSVIDKQELVLGISPGVRSEKRSEIEQDL